VGVAGHCAATFDYFEQSLMKAKTVMPHKMLALLLLFLMGALIMAEDSPLPLFDSTEASATKEAVIGRLILN
jgi:hypothetical protein